MFNLIILRIHSSSSMISKNKLMKAKTSLQVASRRDKWGSCQANNQPPQRGQSPLDSPSPPVLDRWTAPSRSVKEMDKIRTKKGQLRRQTPSEANTCSEKLSCRIIRFRADSTTAEDHTHGCGPPQVRKSSVPVHRTASTRTNLQH